MQTRADPQKPTTSHHLTDARAILESEPGYRFLDQLRLVSQLHAPPMVELRLRPMRGVRVFAAGEPQHKARFLFRSPPVLSLVSC